MPVWLRPRPSRRPRSTGRCSRWRRLGPHAGRAAADKMVRQDSENARFVHPTRRPISGSFIGGEPPLSNAPTPLRSCRFPLHGSLQSRHFPTGPPLDLARARPKRTPEPSVSRTSPPCECTDPGVRRSAFAPADDELVAVGMAEALEHRRFVLELRQDTEAGIVTGPGDPQGRDVCEHGPVVSFAPG